MNKGVIVQLESDVAYVMKNDGVFASCPREPYWQVGDVVTIRRRRLSVKIILASCAVFLCLLVGTGFIVYQIPETYLEITVNPSVQLTVNRFDRILEVAALNEEGESLIQGVVYSNLSLDEAYLRLLNRLENNGYLRDASVLLVIASGTQKKVDDVEQKLQKLSEKYTQTNNIHFYVKRYTSDEYLSLAHPLPVTDLPAISETETEPPYQEQSGQPAEPQQPGDNPALQPSTESQQTEPPAQSNESQQTVPLDSNGVPQETAPADTSDSPPQTTPHGHERWHNGMWDGNSWCW